MRALTDLAVFECYVRDTDPDRCWAWSGFKNKKGYGQVFRHGKTVRAHQLSYALFVGPIPAGQVVRHRCDTPACTNPDHLEIGTNADNTRDRNERGRTARGEATGRAKLTDKAIRELRDLFTVESSDTTLAKQYGVSPSTIWCIRTGRTWRHVS